uniref:Serpin domain-containing protein n=1 Tax=Oryza punctata TaxID=4537 RepID=A0A0E0ME33_ORYPU
MGAWARAGTGLAPLSMRLTKPLFAAAAAAAAAAGGQHGGTSKAACADNLVFSPLSIYSALFVVAAGARGRTLNELLKALSARSGKSPAKSAGEMMQLADCTCNMMQLSKNVSNMMKRARPDGMRTPQPGAPRLAHACAIWHERARTVKPAFRNCAASFKAVTRAVDFLRNPEEACKEINSWVATATENLIDSIVSPDLVNKNTRLVVTSAVYLKGRWATPFDKERTKDKFHLLDGDGDVDADFMRSSRDQYITVHRGFKVLRMPYAALEDRMAAGGEGFLRKHMPERRVEVGEFRIPRFKLSFDGSVVHALRGLGAKALFDPARAELTDVLEADNSGDPPLFVSDVLHCAVIEVNEEGTEAAAATSIIMKWRARRPSPPPVPVDFVADHPFVFLVVEESSGAVLFAGHVVDPTK